MKKNSVKIMSIFICIETVKSTRNSVSNSSRLAGESSANYLAYNIEFFRNVKQFKWLQNSISQQ